MQTLTDDRLHWAARLALVAVACSGAMITLFGIDVVEHLPHATVCLFRNLLGIECPSCGLTRALLLLGQFEGLRALELNPVAPVALLGLLWFALGAPWSDRVARTPLPQFALATLLLFWGFRLFALPAVGG